MLRRDGEGLWVGLEGDGFEFGPGGEVGGGFDGVGVAGVAEELEGEGIIIEGGCDEGGIAGLGKSPGELKDTEVSEMVCVIVVLAWGEFDFEFAVGGGANV